MLDRTRSSVFGTQPGEPVKSIVHRTREQLTVVEFGIAAFTRIDRSMWPRIVLL